VAALVIRQFDVYATPDTPSNADAPFVCVLQSHYLEAMDTVMVAPLLRASAKPTPTQVAVPVAIDGDAHLLDVSLMANIERRSLGRPRGSLLAYEFDIRRALERLFTGF
jgi:toxin CcdB